MVKHLTRHGNSLALIIDKGILELLDITPETPLSLTTDGKGLYITRARDPERENRLEEAIAEAHKRYGRMFKNLAKQ